MALNPAFSAQPQASPVFHRRPTPPAADISAPFCTTVGARTVASRLGRKPCVASHKKIFNFLISSPNKSAWNRNQLQETSARSPLTFTQHITGFICLFNALLPLYRKILQVPKDFPQPQQPRKKHVSERPDGDKRLIHTTPSHFNFLFRVT